MIRVYADIVGDLFHRGHVEFLKKTKNIGEDVFLVIGVHSDEDCEDYKRKPIFTMEDRCEIFRSCRNVDEVIPNAPLRITEDFLNEHSIDIVVHGDDMTDFHRNVNYFVPIQKNIMRYIPYYDSISTTQIIKRIVDGFKKEDN